MSLYISPEQLDLIVHALEFAAAASYEDDAFTTKQRQYMQQLADKLTDLQPDYFPNCDVFQSCSWSRSHQLLFFNPLKDVCNDCHLSGCSCD